MSTRAQVKQYVEYATAGLQNGDRDAQSWILLAIATALNELMQRIADSCCGHGTPELFTPCPDCQRARNQ